MAGRMGGIQVTTLNLEVVQADPEKELILVKGAIPGPRGGMVVLRDTVKGATPEGVVMTIAAAHQLPRRRERPEPARRTVERRSQDGTVLERGALRPEIFGIEPNVAVLHQVVTAQLAAARAGTQSTRTRAEVRGGGAKPFRQKGTGRARQGSTRSPQWTGGGVALGPKPRSLPPAHPEEDDPPRPVLGPLGPGRRGPGRPGRRVVVRPARRPRTAVAALAALELEGRVLVVLGPDDGIADRCFANLPEVQTLRPPSSTPTTCCAATGWCSPTRPCPGETSPAPAQAAAPRREGAARPRKAAARRRRVREDTADAADAEAADAADDADADAARRETRGARR